MYPPNKYNMQFNSHSKQHKYIFLGTIICCFFLIIPQSHSQDEEYYCPPNSYSSGDQCICNAGYGDVNGAGKCVSLSAACAKFDAVWSATANNCVCRPGYYEDTSLNKCLPNGPTPEELEQQKQAELEKQRLTELERQKQESEKNRLAEIAKQESLKKEETQQATEIKSSISSNESFNEIKYDMITDSKRVMEKDNNNIFESKEEEIQSSTSSIESFDTIEHDMITDSKRVMEKDDNNVFENIDKIMQEKYNEGPPEIKKVIEENKEKVEEVAKETFKPSEDIYADIIEENIIAPFKVSLEKSFEDLKPEEKIEAKNQLTTISEFNSNTNDEVFLQKKTISELVETHVVTKELRKNLTNWHKEVDNAIKNGKLKEGLDKENFKLKMEMENEIKLQVASLDKIIGFNHLRCVEAHRGINFDHTPRDYQKYFHGASVHDMFVDEGLEFDKAMKRIKGMSAQRIFLKKELKKNYPKDWKFDYIDVSKKPTKEETKKNLGNIFEIFEKIQKGEI